MDRVSQIIKSIIKTESGITLVELLAALSLLMVVILLAGSIHMFGQRQFNVQNESASQANDISYAITEMSSDLRRYKYSDVKFEKDKIFVQGNLQYQVKEGNLVRDDVLFANSVDTMDVTENGTYGINIKITSESKYAKPKVYETTITFRGVDN